MSLQKRRKSHRKSTDMNAPSRTQESPKAAPEDDVIAELTAVLEKAQQYEKDLDSYKEVVTEFVRWNPMHGTVPNTRIIKKWRTVLVNFLTLSEDFKDSVKQVFQES